MTTFCDIGGEFMFFMVNTLLTFDWMGVWELCFEEILLDAEFSVFNMEFCYLMEFLALKYCS